MNKLLLAAGGSDEVVLPEWNEVYTPVEFKDMAYGELWGQPCWVGITNNYVYTSTDGTSWTKSPWTHTTRGYNKVVFIKNMNTAIFLILGNQGDMAICDSPYPLQFYPIFTNNINQNYYSAEINENGNIYITGTKDGLPYLGMAVSSNDLMNGGVLTDISFLTSDDLTSVTNNNVSVNKILKAYNKYLIILSNGMTYLSDNDWNDGTSPLFYKFYVMNYKLNTECVGVWLNTFYIVDTDTNNVNLIYKKIDPNMCLMGGVVNLTNMESGYIFTNGTNTPASKLTPKSKIKINDNLITIIYGIDKNIYYSIDSSSFSTYIFLPDNNLYIKSFAVRIIVGGGTELLASTSNGSLYFSNSSTFTKIPKFTSFQLFTPKDMYVFNNELLIPTLNQTFYVFSKTKGWYFKTDSFVENSEPILNITYYKGLYIGYNTHYVLTSHDLINWTRKVTTSYTVKKIKIVNDNLVIITDNGSNTTVLISTDGITFTNKNFSGIIVRDIVYIPYAANYIYSTSNGSLGISFGSDISNTPTFNTIYTALVGEDIKNLIVSNYAGQLVEGSTGADYIIAVCASGKIVSAFVNTPLLGSSSWVYRLTMAYSDLNTFLVRGNIVDLFVGDTNYVYRTTNGFINWSYPTFGGYSGNIKAVFFNNKYTILSTKGNVYIPSPTI